MLELGLVYTPLALTRRRLGLRQKTQLFLDADSTRALAVRRAALESRGVRVHGAVEVRIPAGAATSRSAESVQYSTCLRYSTVPYR